jgi:hypothetical protein
MRAKSNNRSNNPQMLPEWDDASTKDFMPASAGIRYVCDPVAFATEVLRWTPDQRQIEALSHVGPRVILNWSRQCGKSTVAAVKAVHTMATEPGCTVLLIGAVQKHLSEFLAKVDRFSDPRFNGLHTSSDWVGGPITRQPGQPFSRCFPNGSRIIGATTDRSARSAATRLIIFDESGQVRDDVWEAALPTLATTDGDIWVVGTPKKETGWYAGLWQDRPKTAADEELDDATVLELTGGSSQIPQDRQHDVKPEPESGQRPWFRSIYRAAENPRIRKSYLREMLRLHGESKFRREFNCEFVSNGASLINKEAIHDMFH